MQVLSYPLNVEENDGHYILFTIFETPAYEYKSPYTDINVPQQKINSSKLQTYGVSDVKRNKIQEAEKNWGNGKTIIRFAEEQYDTFKPNKAFLDSRQMIDQMTPKILVVRQTKPFFYRK